MIETKNFTIIPTDELFTLTERTIELVTDVKLAVPSVVPLLENVCNTYVDFQAALEHEHSDPNTPLIKEKDKIRDNGFLAYRDYLVAAKHRLQPEWPVAAKKLITVVKQLGWTAYNLGYKAESAAIINIVIETRNKYSDELTTINATDWLNELDAAEQAFDTAVKQSLKEVKADDPIIKLVRPKVINDLKALYNFITLLQVGKANPELAALEISLNELVVKSLATAKAAKTRAENKKKAEKKKNTSKNSVEGDEPTE